MDVKSESISNLTSKYCHPLSDTINDATPSNVEESFVSGICLYPVKGCSVFSVSSWPVSETGLYLDRHWCIYSKSDHSHLRLTKSIIQQTIYPFVDLEKNLLILASYRMPGNNFILPINSHKRDCKRFSVIIFGTNTNDVLADCGDDVSRWLSEALDKSDLRLYEQVDPKEDKLSLVSDSHIQLMNVESVRKLAEEVADEQGFFDETLPLFGRRFRANILIGGLASYVENKWDKVRINDVTLECIMEVERCKAVNINYERLEYQVNPLRYLQRTCVGPPVLGIHSNVTDFSEASNISIGDKFVVLSTKN